MYFEFFVDFVIGERRKKSRDKDCLNENELILLYQLVALITQQLMAYLIILCCLLFVHPIKNDRSNYWWIYRSCWLMHYKCYHCHKDFFMIVLVYALSISCI